MTNNYAMATELKRYLDAALWNNPDTITSNWRDGFVSILQKYLGAPPEVFDFEGKAYTPVTFAETFVNIQSSDYAGLTSFKHHPWYQFFVMEVPDNYNNNTYYNLPLDELLQTVKKCLQNGFTFTWDADVSNRGFQARKGLAKWVTSPEDLNRFQQFKEQPFNEDTRQDLFDKQITQDDHLMQVTGLAKDEAGNEFFIVKNSYGNEGPFDGYVYVSIPYFAINTISVLVNKKALPETVLQKLSAAR